MLLEFFCCGLPAVKLLLIEEKECSCLLVISDSIAFFGLSEACVKYSGDCFFLWIDFKDLIVIVNAEQVSRFYAF